MLAMETLRRWVPRFIHTCVLLTNFLRVGSMLVRGIFRPPCLRKLRASGSGKCSTLVIIIVRMGYDSCLKNEILVSFVDTVR